MRARPNAIERDLMRRYGVNHRFILKWNLARPGMSDLAISVLINDSRRTIGPMPKGQNALGMMKRVPGRLRENR